MEDNFCSSWNKKRENTVDSEFPYSECSRLRMSQCRNQWIQVNRAVRRIETIKCSRHLPDEGNWFRNWLQTLGVDVTVTILTYLLLWKITKAAWAPFKTEI